MTSGPLLTVYAVGVGISNIHIGFLQSVLPFSNLVHLLVARELEKGKSARKIAWMSSLIARPFLLLVALAVYYKGTALEGTIKKMEEYVDETDESSPDNYKISHLKKDNDNNIKKDEINKNKSIYKRTISFSENEEVESNENESESYEEEEESEEKEAKEISVNQTNIENDSYLLELKDNGLPNLQNDEIISCNINSLINISINNGISISKDIFMITNAENEFPSPFFLNSLINEIKIKNEKSSTKDDYASNLSLKHQKYLNNLNKDNSVFKQMKKY